MLIAAPTWCFFMHKRIQLIGLLLAVTSANAAPELKTTWQLSAAPKAATGALSWKAVASERGELPQTAVPPPQLPLWVVLKDGRAPAYFHGSVRKAKKASAR